MRLDHIVVHLENDFLRLRALRDQAAAIGYPFDPDKTKGNAEFKCFNINIGSEYIEVVRILKKNAQSWEPMWTRTFDAGERGAFCIFIEVSDVERSGSALKNAGVRVNGPAALHYPGFMGLSRAEAPYSIYYLPTFSGSPVHLALMQYKGSGREVTQSAMFPNASQNGINGIRMLDVELPNLEDSLDLLHTTFPDLYHEGDLWIAQLEQQRISFCQSADHAKTALRVFTTTSQKINAGKSFTLGNVEVRTIGG